MLKIVAGVAVLIMALVGCAVPEEGGQSAAKGGGGGQGSSESDDTYKPTKDDFKAVLKETSRNCFGSAGCNIEYKVGLRWVGPKPAPKLDKAYEVKFTVLGGDMGGTTDTLRVSEGLKYGVYDGYGSTGSVGDKLTAKVIKIQPAGVF